jgi:hypothetical protein
VFFDRDRCGEFTLFEGDIVKFKVATDKRTKFKHAVEIFLMEHSLLLTSNKEKRECGVVERLLENNQQQSKYGAIKSVERDELVYCTANELIFLNKIQLKSAYFDIGDCVEFAVVECQKVSQLITIQFLNFNL